MNKFSHEVSKTLFKGLPLAIASNLVLAIVVAAIQWAVVPAQDVISWLVLMLLALGWRTAIWVAGSVYARDRQVESWLLQLRASTVATGMVWALSPVMLLPPADITSQAFIAFVLAGVSSGALVSLQVDRIAALGYALPGLLSLIVVFGLEDSDVSRAMGLMVCIYLLFYMISSNRAAQQLKARFHLLELLAAEEEKLRVSDRRARSILQTMPDVVFLAQEDGRLVEYFNYSDFQTLDDGALHSTVKETFPIFAAELAITAVRTTMETGEVVSFEYELENPDKSASFEVRVKKVNADEVLLLIRNITQKKNTERALRNQQKLMIVIARAQENFIRKVDHNHPYDTLLNDLLELTSSEYGFIGEVLHTDDGQPYLKSHAITDISWNEETRAYYEAGLSQGMDFFNLNTLFGAVLTSGEPVIANDPCHDPRSGGVPEGHPALNAFLGVPIHYDGEMVAMLGLANRPGGYDQDLLDFLKPLRVTLGQLVAAARDRQRHSADRLVLARLSQVASQTTNAVVITDALGITEWVNAGFSRMTGYRPEEIVGLKPGNVLQGPDTDLNTVMHMSSALAQGKGFEVEVLNYTKDGKSYWIHIHCNPLSDEKGSLQGFIAIQTNITEAKEAAQALQSSEARLRALFELSPLGIALNDYETGQFIEFNEALLRPTGYSRDEFAKLGYTDITPGEYAAQEKMQLESMEKSGQYGPYEKEYLRKDGSRYPVLLSGVVVNESAGRKFIWSIVEDISERKRLERIKSEFIANVSHELRTPLTAISGALGLVVSGAVGPVQEGFSEMIEIAVNNSKRLGLLVNDLLDMEKLAVGKLRFDMQEQALQPLLQRAISDIQGSADSVGVHLVLDAAHEGIFVELDSNRFQQVMANLLSNAIKFSPWGGEVQVSIKKGAGKALISVADHGPGIPKEFRKHIFEKFSQADNSATRKHGGTGLGLAISRELTEHMGGTVGFYSVPGDGATFYLEFPLAMGREK